MDKCQERVRGEIMDTWERHAAGECKQSNSAETMMDYVSLPSSLYVSILV